MSGIKFNKGNVNELLGLNSPKVTETETKNKKSKQPYVFEDKKYRKRNMRSPRVILDILFKFYQPKTAIDVGCALCCWTEVLKSHGITVTAIDGEWYDKESVEIADNFICHNLNNGVLKIDKVDLAICLEVAEHVEATHAKDLVETLTGASDVILFSAAIPKQGGQGHVNEQWMTYWKEMFEERDYLFADIIRPVIWTNKDVEVWYRQNTVMFIHKDKYQGILDDYKKCGFENNMINVVHPEYWKQKVK